MLQYKPQYCASHQAFCYPLTSFFSFYFLLYSVTPSSKSKEPGSWLISLGACCVTGNVLSKVFAHVPHLILLSNAGGTIIPTLEIRRLRYCD